MKDRERIDCIVDHLSEVVGKELGGDPEEMDAVYYYRGEGEFWKLRVIIESVDRSEYMGGVGLKLVKG